MNRHGWTYAFTATSEARDRARTIYLLIWPISGVSPISALHRTHFCRFALTKARAVRAHLLRRDARTTPHFPSARRRRCSAPREEPSASTPDPSDRLDDGNLPKKIHHRLAESMSPCRRVTAATWEHPRDQLANHSQERTGKFCNYSGRQLPLHSARRRLQHHRS